MDLKRIMLEEYEYAYKGIATGTLLVMKKLYTVIIILVMQIYIM